MGGIVLLKGKNGDAEAEELLQELFRLLAPLALGEAVAQLVERDDRQRDRRAGAQLLAVKI
ncbi:hypothetical protein BHK69_21725 [Bosea vaviloviae]|uniref:Uncharacterized protein n=1 Tax=Bosea vaviloviae TaxID=1526658 RepID=A0A1D7U5P9_9HYPH|nr:hypothetical protein BHK69_21725 [Bosea vaviloviae]